MGHPAPWHKVKQEGNDLGARPRRDTTGLDLPLLLRGAGGLLHAASPEGKEWAWVAAWKTEAGLHGLPRPLLSPGLQSRCLKPLGCHQRAPGQALSAPQRGSWTGAFRARGI